MNKVILIGRLTKDPDIHYTQSQNVTCNFTLAVNREFKNQNGQYEADFIPVVLWGKTAEAAGNSLAKGHRLCVEGRMQVRTYEDKQGKTVWVTEVIGNRIEFLEEHLAWLHKGIAEGSNCFGYHMWTPIDCWSWKNAYKNRYGFIAVDLATQKKTVKKSGYWMKRVIEQNGF